MLLVEAVDSTRPLSIEHTFVVEGECHGWRLDRFLQKKIPRLSRARLQRVIRGDCQVDGRIAKPSQRLSPGQRVAFRRPAPFEPPTPRLLPLLRTDPSFYIFDKPSGLPMHPSAKYHYGTVTALLRELYPSEPLQIAHRLDLETSGLLLVARTRDAARFLKQAFARRLIQKRYLAITVGVLSGEGVIDRPLGPCGGLVRVKMAVRPGGLPSRTRYRVLPSGASSHSLVECAPETGRQHQIRAHLDSIGHPIVGDKLYPDERIFADFQDGGWETVKARLLHERQALHASALRFPHPSGDGVVEVESPLPSDLQQLLDRLSG